jgi:hypothetical protein
MANRTQIKDPDLIYPGQKLIIPAVPKRPEKKSAEADKDALKPADQNTQPGDQKTSGDKPDTEKTPDSKSTDSSTQPDNGQNPQDAKQPDAKTQGNEKPAEDASKPAGTN